MNVPAKGHSPRATVQDLLGKGLREMAREVADEALAQRPHDPDALRTMALVMESFGDYVETGKLCERVLQLIPDDAETLAFMTGAWFRAGEYGKAIACVRRLRARYPHVADPYLEEARILLRLEGVDAAQAALDSRPKSVDNPGLRRHVEGSVLIAQRRDTEAEAALIDATRASELTKEMRAYAWFEIVKIRDRGGDYDGAWAAATEGHALLKQRFDFPAYDKLLVSIRQFFGGKQMQQLAHATQRDTQAVFIVGMPRSGTTLLEQILSMHPDVANAGELAVSNTIHRRIGTLTDSYLPWPRCMADMQERDADVLQRMYQEAVAEVGAGKLRVTNKALVLQHHLGMLSLILPGCYSIMLHRHPLDNIVSCYTTDLVGSGHTYTSDLATLAKVWIARRQMQDFWSETLERPSLQLHYEQLVADQEAQTRRLLEFLELPWNDACLSFHKSTRKVATISHDQVSRKMYSSSKGRWHNYERHLGPAIELLGKFLD